MDTTNLIKRVCHESITNDIEFILVSRSHAPRGNVPGIPDMCAVSGRGNAERPAAFPRRAWERDQKIRASFV